MDQSNLLVEAIRAWRERKFIRYAAKIIPIPAFIAIVLSGCAMTTTSTTPSTPKQSIVTLGDQADVHFTCRLKNGEVAISTYQDAAGDSSLPKSTIFLARDRNTPLTLTAGKPPVEMQGVQEKGFEGEILSQLSKAIVGLPIGEKQTLELRTERLPERQKDEHLLKMARVRQRAKEMRFTPEEYKAKTGKEPQLGRAFVLDPALPGKIESVNEKEVIVRFSPEPGKEVTTPFGKGIVRELPDRYEIVIDARVGRMVRSGTLIGRIVDVNDREISIDYSHPFGGEPLLCDVLVESVKRGAQ